MIKYKKKNTVYVYNGSNKIYVYCKNKGADKQKQTIQINREKRHYKYVVNKLLFVNFFKNDFSRKKAFFISFLFLAMFFDRLNLFFLDEVPIMQPVFFARKFFKKTLH